MEIDVDVYDNDFAYSVIAVLVNKLGGSVEVTQEELQRSYYLTRLDRIHKGSYLFGVEEEDYGRD
jgi:hypothetical protein